MSIQWKLWGSSPRENQPAVRKQLGRFVKAPIISILTRVSTYYSPVAVLSLLFSAVTASTPSGAVRGVN